MPTNDQIAPSIRPISISFFLGLIIFVAAFFLPAVKEGDSFIVGYKCARITFGMMFSLKSYTGIGFLYVMSGWINLFIVFYVLCSLSKRTAAAKPYLAIAIIPCVAATWIVLFSIPLCIGNVMWIAGTLIVIAPEIASWKLNLLRNV